MCYWSGRFELIRKHKAEQYAHTCSQFQVLYKSIASFDLVTCMAVCWIFSAIWWRTLKLKLKLVQLLKNLQFSRLALQFLWKLLHIMLFVILIVWTRIVRILNSTTVKHCLKWMVLHMIILLCRHYEYFWSVNSTLLFNNLKCPTK